MLRTIIQFLAILLTLQSSYFLLKSNLGLSSMQIAELSTVGAGVSPWVTKSLAAQSAETRIGLALLLMAFLLQLFNSLWPMRFVDFEISKTGVLAAVALSVLIFALSIQASRSWQKHIYDGAMAILEKDGPMVKESPFR